MAWVLGFLVFLAALVVGVCFGWRYAARRRSLPCPAWMSGLLTSPLTGRGGAGARLLDQLELAPGMRVLDVGCGPGRVSVPAAERVGPNGQVVALDLQAAMLAKLKKRATARGVQNIV